MTRLKQLQPTLGLMTYSIIWMIEGLGAQTLPSPAPLMTPSTPSDITEKADFDTLCQPLLQETTASSDTPSQQLMHCQAAQSAKESLKMAKITTAAWSATAALCWSTCLMSYSIQTLLGPSLCTAANVSAGITDAVTQTMISQSFQNIMMPMISTLLGAGAGAYQIHRYHQMKQNAPSDTIDPQPGVSPPPSRFSKMDLSSCLAATIASTQALQKGLSINSHQKTLENHLKEVQKLKSTSTSSGAIQPALTSTPGKTQASSTQSANVSNRISDSESPNNPLTMSETPLKQQAALAAETPAWIQDPLFQKDFNKMTGQPLAQFLAQEGPPEETIALAMSHTLPAQQTEVLKESLRQLSDTIKISTPSSVYQSASTQRKVSTEDPSFDQIMSNWMGKMNPTASPTPTVTPSTLSFSLSTLSAEAIASQKNLSLFDRVHNRYQTLEAPHG